MIIDCGKTDSRLVFCEDFKTRESIQSHGGAIVGGRIGNGIIPTAASSRVTFSGTENVCINSTQMTIVLKFKTPSTTWAANKPIISKSEEALSSFAWSYELANTSWLVLYMGAAGNILYIPNLELSTEYVIHAVYNGGLAAALRGVAYSNGVLAVGGAISGTLPTSILSTTRPITALNRDTGATRAPQTDFILRSVKIYNVSFTSDEVVDDYNNRTYSEIY